MLEVEQDSGVSVLRLRHGKVNALDLELLHAITEALAAADEQTAVVITGTGTAFSAGVDLQRVVAGGAPYLAEFLPALTAAFLAIFDHPGPVLAAINGHAIAGGCVIAAACDVRVMSQGMIGLAELSVGVPFPVAALEIVRHAAGPAASRLARAAQPSCRPGWPGCPGCPGAHLTCWQLQDPPPPAFPGLPAGNSYFAAPAGGCGIGNIA
jgi:enoyl-CoA hydratase